MIKITIDLRHPKWIDLNPSAGNSFWGLTRAQAKSIAMFFIIAGLLLMSPPGLPDPTDVINVLMAHWIISYFGVAPATSLAISYTIIPWLIFLIGIWIFPANTMTMFNGYINKLKFYIKKYSKKPQILLIAAIAGYLIFKFYLSLLG